LATLSGPALEDFPVNFPPGLASNSKLTPQQWQSFISDLNGRMAATRALLPGCGVTCARMLFCLIVCPVGLPYCIISGQKDATTKRQGEQNIATFVSNWSNEVLLPLGLWAQYGVEADQKTITDADGKQRQITEETQFLDFFAKTSGGGGAGVVMMPVVQAVMAAGPAIQMMAAGGAYLKV